MVDAEFESLNTHHLTGYSGMGVFYGGSVCSGSETEEGTGGGFPASWEIA